MARVVAAAGVALFNEPELFVFDLLQIDALRFICIFNFIGKNRFKVQINDPPENRSKIKCIDLVFGKPMSGATSQLDICIQALFFTIF